MKASEFKIGLAFLLFVTVLRLLCDSDFVADPRSSDEKIGATEEEYNTKEENSDKQETINPIDEQVILEAIEVDDNVEEGVFSIIAEGDDVPHEGSYAKHFDSSTGAPDDDSITEVTTEESAVSSDSSTDYNSQPNDDDDYDDYEDDDYTNDQEIDETIDSIPNPIDEFIAKETTDGSSLRTVLTFLKDHSLPESYLDDIKTQDDVETETARCARYGYEYNPSITRRRRVFMGSLIADDSWHVIAAHAAETYGLYHTVAFIESNTTQTQTVRETRFDEGSLNYRMLQSGIFGPNTDVYVDFRVDVAKDYPELDAFRRENLQRSHITERWKEAGMQPDDIGIICDVDEMFTRDFLLALQTCDVPQFRPGQDCAEPQITGQGLKLEIVPDCAFPGAFYDHPQAVIGECIENIGDADLHQSDLRSFSKTEGGHLIGKRDFSPHPDRTEYPLWEPWDFRRAPNKPILEEGRLHSAYHFHNFFDSFTVMRNKYKTFALPREDADFMPISSMQRAAKMAISCLKGKPGKHVTFDNIEGRRPILFEHEDYRILRLKEMVKEVEEDERRVETYQSQ